MINKILISKSKEVLFIDEEASYRYNPSTLRFEKSVVSEAKKAPCILSDNYVELKNLTIPLVSAKLLPDIIFNTIKKYLTYIPEKSDIDFEIIGKDEKEYQLAVFINKYPDKQLLSERKVYTVYDITSNLMKDQSYPDNCCFIIQESHALFVYHYNERKFAGREILFAEDLSTVQEESCFFIHANGSGEDIEHHYRVVGWQTVGKMLAGLSVSRFSGKKIFSPSLVLYALVFLLLLGGIITGELILRDKNEYTKALTTSIENLQKTYRNKKNFNAGKSEEADRILELLRRKSYINEFFNYLYQTAGDSIKITSVQYSKPTFIILGVCKSDSLLENAFHTGKLWKGIEISFNKKGSTITFRVEGVFDYDKR